MPNYHSRKESLVIKEFKSDVREIIIIEYTSDIETLIFQIVNGSDIQETKQFERAYESSLLLNTNQNENSNKTNSLKSRNILINFEAIIVTESIEDFNIESFRNAENQAENSSSKLNEKIPNVNSLILQEFHEGFGFNYRRGSRVDSVIDVIQDEESGFRRIESKNEVFQIVLNFEDLKMFKRCIRIGIRNILNV